MLLPFFLDMHNFRYTYEPPGKDSPAYYDGVQPAYTPCSLWYKPYLYNTTVADNKKTNVHYSSPIPWHLNIRELHVEGRIEFEVLRRLPGKPTHKNPLIRILPPPIQYMENIEKTVGITVLSKDETDLKLAGEIVKLTKGAIFHSEDIPLDVFIRSEIIIIPYNYMNTYSVLAAAVSAQCGVICSDCGSAEEYLATKAMPGTWHIIRRQNAKEYYNAALDIMDVENEFLQRVYHRRLY